MGLTRKKALERRAIGRAFLFGLTLSTSVFAVTVAALAGSVEPSTEQIAAYEKSTEGARVKLLIALAKQGQHELADTMLQRYPLTEKYAVNRTLYIEGLILRGRKDNEGAASKFRAALADDPKLTVVRSELAQTLADMGEDDSAKHHLKLLEAEAPDEQAAANIRAFVKHIDSNRPYKFSAFMSLAPTTNFNNGSSHNSTQAFNFYSGTMDDATIEKKSRKRSGVGLQTGGSVSYNKALSEHFTLLGTLGASASVYKDKSYDSFNLSQSVDLRYNTDLGSVSVGFGANEGKNLKIKEKSVTNPALDPSVTPPDPGLVSTGQGASSGPQNTTTYSFGPRVSVSMNVTQRDIITASISVNLQRYPKAKAINSWVSYSDLAWTHFVDPSFNVTTSVGFNRLKSDYDAYSYKTFYAGLGVYKELPHGLTVNLSGQVQRSLFDEYNLLGQTVRKDTRAIGSLGIVKRDWNIFGFAPSVEYTFVKNFSNLRIYDYDSHNFDIRLTKDF
jgi:outer membrane protein